MGDNLMSNIRDLCFGNKRLLPLVTFAIHEGWEVSRTSGGHLKFTKAGFTPIFTSTTASDFHSSRNAQARLRRAEPHYPGGRDG